jgi:GNAT superfamily N-acetyltransferase
MIIRTFGEPDRARLLDLTIATFGPYLEDGFRPLVGDVVFEAVRGDWREDYRSLLAGLHDPARNSFVVVAEADGQTVGYAGYSVEPERGYGRIEILAVASGARRSGVGSALCEHAFAQMRELGARMVEIGTGGRACGNAPLCACG